MDPIWWILIGVGVFAVFGWSAMDDMAHQDKDEIAATFFIGSTIVVAVYLSVNWLGLSWWQFLYWSAYLALLGLIAGYSSKILSIFAESRRSA